MERLASKVKKIQDNSIMLYKRVNQDRILKKVFTNNDKNYLGSDKVEEARQYWSNYTKKANLDFIKYYSSRTGLYSKYYIPDNLYYSYIDMHFNNSKMSYGIDDKAYYDKLFPNFKTPFTAIRKINGFFMIMIIN